jgi:hypothetical protein
MKNERGLTVEQIEKMSEVERVAAAFMNMTNSAIANLQKELEVANAIGDQEQKKRFNIQISMYQHAQSIFDMAVKSANHGQNKNE